MVMKNLALATISLTVLAGASLAAGEGTDPAGVWLRDDGNARVKIASCGEALCATNLWIGDSSGGEEVGDMLVMTVKPESNGELVGTAYDRKRDRTYSITIEKKNGRLVTRGCLLGRLLCRDVSWTPAQ